MMCPARRSNGSAGVALLLDTSPSVWTSVDEFHFRLARALTARGIRVVIVYAEDPPADYSTRMTAGGAVIETLSYGRGRARYFTRLGGLFRRHRIDMIQTRGFNYFSMLWWMVRCAGVRRMIFVEGNSGLLRSRGLWRKCLLRLRASVLTYPISRVVAVTDFVRRQLVVAGLRRESIRAIYNGVDLSRFRPSADARDGWRHEHGIGKEEVLISTVSYLRAFKHPRVVLEACAMLARRGAPVRLAVAGDGDLLGPMQQLSRELGVAGKVLWLRNYSRVETLLQASDVFVLASVGEAIGNVLLEAMACGTPSVGTDSGGIPEIIDHGNTGFLAAPLDCVAFADCIGKIVGDPALRARMSERSVERAHARFDVDRSVHDFLTLYSELWPVITGPDAA